MKIGIFSIPELKPGKYNVKDERLDEVYKIAKSQKKTYLQVELVSENVLEADAIITPRDSGSDIILLDLEFVDGRLSRSEEEQEKALLLKLKNILEKEEFIFKAGLSPEERQAISGYVLYTNKPIVLAEKEELDNLDNLLSRALRESGYISFFTAGEKETRAWLIRQGITVWEAAGAIHSDIQKGFIRAEVIKLDDFMQAGGETQAKQAGKLRLEQKDYIVQDADLLNIRFNK